MKYFYLLLITLISAELLGQSMPVVSPDNQWNVYVASIFSPNSYTKQYSFSHEITVIEDQEYHELLMTEEENGEFVGTGNFFREEGERVYEYRFGSEHLIYDFAMEVGDSITYAIDGAEITLVMWSIENVEMMDQSNRRLYTLKCVDDPDGREFIWWEGIGSMLGIGNESLQCFLDIPYVLSCFFNNQKSVYENIWVGDCWKVNNSEVLQDLYRIFPNPVQDYLTIEDINTPFEYVIKTMDGKAVESGQGELRIEVQHLPAGMYILEIVTENKIGVMKFVKQ